MLALDGNPEKVKNASGKVIDLVADGTWNFTKGDPGIQGANGLCYALLMLDAGDYNNPKQPELRNNRASGVSKRKWWFLYRQQSGSGSRYNSYGGAGTCTLL